MEDLWDDFLKEIEKHGITPDDHLNDLYHLMTFENKEIGEIRSLKFKGAHVTIRN